MSSWVDMDLKGRLSLSVRFIEQCTMYVWWGPGGNRKVGNKFNRKALVMQALQMDTRQDTAFWYLLVLNHCMLESPTPESITKHNFKKGRFRML